MPLSPKSNESLPFCMAHFEYPLKRCADTVIALFGCYMAGACETAAVLAHILCTPYNHAPCHITS